MAQQLPLFIHKPNLIIANVHVELNSAEILRMGRAIRNRAVRMLADDMVMRAKQNVAPGIGPGPHDHKSTWPTEGKSGYPGWHDSGDLADSISWEQGPIGSDGISIDVVSRLKKPGGRPIQDDWYESDPGPWYQGSPQYNIDLEEGWTSQDGNHQQYPFMIPARDETIARAWEIIMRAANPIWKQEQNARRAAGR